MEKDYAAGWQMEGDGPPAQTASATVASFVETHLRSLRSAYPQLWDWLSSLDERYHLIPWLRANRAHVTALRRLSDDQLDEVQEAVYGGMFV